MAPLDEPVEVIRSRSHQVFCLVTAAFCLIFVVGGGVGAFGQSDPAPQLVVVLIFVVFAGAAIRWSLSSVVFDYAQDALIVRNPLRTHRIAWSDVDGFSSVNSHLPSNAGDRQVVKVTRKDGSRITCVGACAPGFSSALAMSGQLSAAYTRRNLEMWKRANPDARRDR